MAEFKKGLDDLKKHIKSWETLFEAGNSRLQATWARAIQSYMHLVVQKGHKKFEASEMLALTAGFAARTGSWLIRLWAIDWMVYHELPILDRGQHIKVKSLLKDPSICAEMWTYLCSHKWATNLKKFANFTEQKLSQLKQKYMPSISLTKKCLMASRNILRLSCSCRFKWRSERAFQLVQLTNGWNVKASITQNTKKHCISMGTNALMWFIIASTHSCHLWLSIESVGGVLKGWRVELWHIWACCQKPPWWSENIGAVCSWWVHNAGKWQWQSRMGSRGWAAIAEEGCWSWFSSEWCHFLNSGMAWRSRSTAWIWKRLWQILDWQAFCKAGKNTQSITGNY